MRSRMTTSGETPPPGSTTATCLRGPARDDPRRSADGRPRRWPSGQSPMTHGRFVIGAVSTCPGQASRLSCPERGQLANQRAEHAHGHRYVPDDHAVMRRFPYPMLGQETGRLRLPSSLISGRSGFRYATALHAPAPPPPHAEGRATVTARKGNLDAVDAGAEDAESRWEKGDG